MARCPPGPWGIARRWDGPLSTGAVGHSAAVGWPVVHQMPKALGVRGRPSQSPVEHTRFSVLLSPRGIFVLRPCAGLVASVAPREGPDGAGADQEAEGQGGQGRQGQGRQGSG
eukprot:scaffold47_cov112-Isochrysis_galbana.AAC.9